MSRSPEFCEPTAINSSPAVHATTASERLSLEFSSTIASPSTTEQQRLKVSSNDVPPILLPAPQPQPEPIIHTGTKDGRPFIVIETPYEFK